MTVAAVTDGIAIPVGASGTVTLNWRTYHLKPPRVPLQKPPPGSRRPSKKRKNIRTTTTLTHKASRHPPPPNLNVGAGSAVHMTPTLAGRLLTVGTQMHLSQLIRQTPRDPSASKILANCLMPAKEVRQLVTAPVCARRR